MTPAAFKAARKALGLSVEDMARALRLKDARSVRRYEDGSREISGPIETLLAYIQRFGFLDINRP